jgi:SAM-dependent methyltransferase
MVETLTIQRQYNEVIAPRYDLDPWEVTGRSLDRAVEQIRKQHLLGDGEGRLAVYDVGAGTGMFLSRLKALGGERVRPFALDLSEKMIAHAARKIPDLATTVDTAANLDAHFPGESFDLISTHFITGFVPLGVLAPKVRGRLAEGGHWSLIAGTRAGYPALQAKAHSKVARWLCGGRKLVVEEVSCLPAGRDDIVRGLEANGFAVRECETFEPALPFANFNEFMAYAYHGGWLTPFVEALGLHKAGALTRLLLNWFIFPIKDHHNIEIVLAQKVADG